MEKYLVIRGSGGLSNRIQAAAGGMAYCLLTGRTLVVDWRDGLYSDDFTNVFPRYFDLFGLRHSPDIPSGGSVAPVFWEKWLREPVAVEYLFENDHLNKENYSLTSIDVTKLDYEEDILVAWAPDLRLLASLAPLLAAAMPRFQGCDERRLFRLIMEECCTPVASARSEVEAFARQYFKPGATIGMHIRHTDLQSPLESFIATLRSIPGMAESVIFLTTDNRFVQQSLKRLFPNLVHTEKFFPANAEPLHSHFPGADNVRKGMEALIDMLLLAKCDYVLHHALSSFSRVPVLLSGLPSERVIAIG